MSAPGREIRFVPRRAPPAGAPRTTRLALERLSPGHLDELCRLHGDARVMATLGGVRSEEATRRWLEVELEHWERHGFGIWVARLRGDGRFAGRGGLRHTHIGDRDEVELAYAVAADHWGEGLAPELAETALALGFEGLGLADVVCFTEPANRASLRVMEKAGFRFEREVERDGYRLRLHRLTAAERGDPRYAIRLAQAEECAALAEVERAAGKLFSGLPIDGDLSGDLTPPEKLAEALRECLLWVALGPAERPVGFAMARELDGALHLAELSVAPAHGRRGLGAALVDTVCDGARRRGLPAVTLTTYREPEWNAPLYRRLGFRVLEPAELTPGLADQVRREDAAGLSADARVVMRLEVAAN